jgi:DUF4097 and DUF4098 domain-containing protein YvlB
MKRLFFLLLLFPQLASARIPNWVRRVGWLDAPEVGGAGEQIARLPTHGAVKLRLHSISGDVEVIAGGQKQVTVKISEGNGAHVSFREDGGDRVELLFDGMPLLRCGRVCVEVPRGSALDVASDSGDVMVRGVGGDVRARATGGDVLVESAGAVAVRSVSGDVAVREASGDVRVDTVSGDVVVGTTGAGGKVAVNTTSGDVHWSGNCGNGCRLEARTLSGDVLLSAGDKSSVALRFQTHTGDVSNELKLSVASGPRPPREPNFDARYGAGDGVVEVQTFSGDLHLARAR